jgi:anti-sigma-K factor RskA
MIDERHEELAALYALDLLAGAERTEFEAALARDPALRDLVQELRESSAALAHAAPAVPPPAALKDRVLASIDAENVIRPAPTVFRPLLPWAIAASFALGSAWLGARYLAVRNENEARRQQQALTDVAWQTAQTTLESERVIAQRQLATITETNRQLAAATERATQLATQRQQLEEQLAAVRPALAERERQLAQTEAAAAERSRQVAALTQRVDALTRAATEMGQQLAAAQQVADKLDAQLREQATVADMKIATLASMLKNSPQAIAVALWDPKRHEGVVTFEKMPVLAANQNFELWVIEGREGAKPVSAGVFRSKRDGTGRVEFKPTAAVATVATFAVSREKDDGVHAAPSEVIMLGHAR